MNIKEIIVNIQRGSDYDFSEFKEIKLISITNYDFLENTKIKLPTICHQVIIEGYVMIQNFDEITIDELNENGNITKKWNKETEEDIKSVEELVLVFDKYLDLSRFMYLKKV